MPTSLASLALETDAADESGRDGQHRADLPIRRPGHPDEQGFEPADRIDVFGPVLALDGQPSRLDFVQKVADHAIEVANRFRLDGVPTHDEYENVGVAAGSGFARKVLYQGLAQAGDTAPTVFERAAGRSRQFNPAVFLFAILENAVGTVGFGRGHGGVQVVGRDRF